MEKRIPNRMCIACREMKPKNALLRIVRETDGTLALNGGEFHPGRSAYICPTLACLTKAEKTRGLERAFHGKVESSFYEFLKEGVKDA